MKPEADPVACNGGDCKNLGRVPTPAGPLCRTCAAELAREMEAGR